MLAQADFVSKFLEFIFYIGRLTPPASPADSSRAAALIDSLQRQIDSVETSDDRASEHSSWYVYVLFGVMLIGATISAVGFTLWYIRNQRPLDRSVDRGSGGLQPPAA
jgi:hypothetical protein